MAERINRVIELLAQDQPVYYTGPSGRGYEGGKADAQTWAQPVLVSGGILIRDARGLSLWNLR